MPVLFWLRQQRRQQLQLFLLLFSNPSSFSCHLCTFILLFSPSFQLCPSGPKRTLAHTSFCPMCTYWSTWHLRGSWLRYDTQRKMTGSLNSSGGSWGGERRCCCVICYFRTGQYVSMKVFFLNGQDVFTFLLTGLGKSGITKWFDLIWLVDVVQWWTSTVHLIIWQLWHKSASPSSKQFSRTASQMV